MPTKSTIITKKQLTERISSNLNLQRTKLTKKEVEKMIDEFLLETKKPMRVPAKRVPKIKSSG